MSGFDERVKTHTAFVRRVVSAYERDPAVADDVVQEVWLAL